MSKSVSLPADDTTLPAAVPKRPILKCADRPKEAGATRSIKYGNVDTYLFERQQGFCCVPQVGGCTLGMGMRHFDFKTTSLAEKLTELKPKPTHVLKDINSNESADENKKSEDDIISKDDAPVLQGTPQKSSPNRITAKGRRALLKQCGVSTIDTTESVECEKIRISRKSAIGCSCVNDCKPPNCECYEAGINCQVESYMYPCPCTRETCRNTFGCRIYSKSLVHEHFEYTKMRLAFENFAFDSPSNDSSDEGPIGSSPTSLTHNLVSQ